MRLHRFYVNKPLGEEIVVESVSGSSEEKEILNQWLRVFRFSIGSDVLLFSPSQPGTDFRYTITSISKEGAKLSLAGKSSNLILDRPITLYMAIVKKDTFETIVRQATELGVFRIIPILAERSEKKNLNFDRLQSIAKEAAEQCGRGNVPEISEIVDFATALSSSEGETNIIGSLQGTTYGDSSKKDQALAIWIGPEGGWTPEEEATAKKAGFRLLKLTETTLKADTAAITALSLFAIQS
jgi:16S rRNA (uracil1498-N3)-methyltransferase